MKYILFLSLILLTGCVTPGKVSSYLQKEKNKAESEVIVGQYLNLNELFSATYFNNKYPIRESRTTETFVEIDTVLVPGPEVECPETIDKETGQTYTPKVKCPDVTYLQKTIKEKESIIQESTAKADMYKQKYLEEQALRIKNEVTLQSKLEASQSEVTALTESRDKWRSRCIGLVIGVMSVLAVVGFFKFYLLR